MTAKSPQNLKQATPGSKLHLVPEEEGPHLAREGGCLSREDST